MWLIDLILYFSNTACHLYSYGYSCSFFLVMLFQNRAGLHRWVDVQLTGKQLDALESPTHLFCTATCAPQSVTSAENFWRESLSKACSARTATAMHIRSVLIRFPKIVLVSLSSMLCLLNINFLVCVADFCYNRKYVHTQFWLQSLLSLLQPVTLSVQCSFLPTLHGTLVMFVIFISNFLAVCYFILFMFYVCFNYNTVFILNDMLFIIINK
jgi:hypothetical protein